MDPHGILAALMERHPVVGWALATASVLFGALPTWLIDARDVLGVMSVVFGVVIGYFTIRIQADQWRERRERRKRPETNAPERPPWH